MGNDDSNGEYFAEYQLAIQVQMHFNDLLMKMRSFGITSVVVILGYAATAAYLLQTDGALDMGPLASANFSNALILISVSLIVGALFGLGSGKLSGVLTKGD